MMYRLMLHKRTAYKHSWKMLAILSLLFGMLSSLWTAPAHAAEPHVDNPYVGATAYVNPDYAALIDTSIARVNDSELAAKMEAVKSVPTAVWLDRIEAIYGGEDNGGRRSLEEHLDLALQQKQANIPLTIEIVIYNLPDRDCAALASNGTLHSDKNGMHLYKTEYIDKIYDILSKPKYGNLRIVTIIEPDSLPNLVTNLSTPKCAKVNQDGTYVEGTQYAISKLRPLSNVYIYLDIAHAGWLGWDNNMSGTVQLFKQVVQGTGSLSNIDGFVSNVSNYTPLEEPNLPNPDLNINGMPIRSSNFYEWNSEFDELDFTRRMYQQLTAAGFPSTIGFLIDTSRNGWGGNDRPDQAIGQTVNDYVDSGRVDRRYHRGNWCNVSGAGIGERPQAQPYGANSHVDAFVWIKPPGESDGTSDSSQTTPDDEGKSFDPMCSPDHITSSGYPTGAMDGAPTAGHWFHNQFKMLVENAYPAITPAPSTVPSAPAGLSASPADQQVSLSWNPVSNATSYNVKRSTSSGGPYTTIAQHMASTQYLDQGLTNGTTYYYVVSAVNAIGESANSAQVSAAPGQTPAPEPFTLSAAASNGKVTLNWTSSLYATNYKVQRSTSSSGPYTVIASQVSQTSYEDSGVANGTTYYYVITAENSTGSTNSNEVEATPQQPPQTSGLKVQYYAADQDASNNQMRPHIRIVNDGSSAAALEDLKVRYWFTNDSGKALQYFCDWSQVNCSNIQAQFGILSSPAADADTYLELSFSSQAGTIPANGNSGDIQNRIHYTDWSNFNETNDYSFDSTATAYVLSDKITLYQNDVLIWGTEPGTSGHGSESELVSHSEYADQSAFLSADAASTNHNEASIAAHQARFMQLYQQIKDPANGYFSPEGIPYHSIETLLSEAPDYGHMTTSEAYSYWLWLEAIYGYYTGDWSKLEAAWDNMETYIIPVGAQPTMGYYNPSSPATYAPERAQPDLYPTPMSSSVAAGRDPLDAELKASYGSNETYLMHWLLDVDDWYGFGNLLQPNHTATYVNTFQRGEQESVWEAITHPSQDNKTFGKPNEGFMTLFISENQAPAAQWRYTAATDADARAVQVMYWAKEFGYNNSTYLNKARKMGDFLRYGMYDKYFQQIGSAADGSPNAGNGKDASHYLMAWYTAWGGGLGQSDGQWAWRIGSSHVHQAYQNTVAAYALSQGGLVPASPTAQADWETSLRRQLEFYTWLLSAEGGMGGGATNSWNGDYSAYPAGVSTFYDLVYDEAPVYHDPPSNTWFGFQAWPLERVAELYYILASNGDTSSENFQMAKLIMDKWIDWSMDYMFVNERPVTDSEGYFLDPLGNRILGGHDPVVATVPAPGEYYFIGGQEWQGQPDTWNGFANFSGNPNYRAIAKGVTQDVGVLGSYIKALTYYAAATKAETGNYTAQGNEAKNLAEQLLDVAWTFNDGIGIAIPEQREDYYRYFTKEIYFPAGWSGTYGQGNTIPGPGAVPSDPAKGGNGVYISYAELRPDIKNDPQWSYLENLYNTSWNPQTQKWENGVPTFTYHRFWAQVDMATAYAEFDRLIGITAPQPPNAPTGLNASVDNGQVHLSWNSVPGAETYKVKRAASPGGTYTEVAAGLTNNQYTDTGLTNGTTYYYVVSAVNAYGESPNSAEVSATPNLPSVPGNFTLSASASAGRVALSWTASSGASSYDVLRSVSAGGSGTVIATGLTALSYQDTNVTNGTTYYYTVRAVNSAGERLSNQVSATPQQSSNVKVEYRAADNDPLNNQMKPNFRIVNNGSSNIALSDLTIRYWFTNDSGKSLQYFCDWAQISCSNIQANFVTMNTPAPQADTYLELSFTSGAGSISAGGNTGEMQIRLHYTDWSNFNESNDYSYDGTMTQFGSNDRVTLYHNGQLIYGIEPTGPPNNNPSAPGAPSEAYASGGDAQVLLNWNAGEHADSYNVKRSFASGGPYQTIAQHITALSYIDQAVTNGTTYYYTISSVNQVGESANSVEVSATPLADSSGLYDYPYAPSMAPDQEAANAELAASYQQWKSTYVTSDGAGGFLRVKRPEDGNDSVSEGIAYGMLLSAYMDDQATFDQLWGYAKSHFNANGFMHWRIDANNQVTGLNGATDAEEDMAFALIVADNKWGGYEAEAKGLISRMLEHEVEAGTYVLKPGDAWGGSSVTNPSYFAPAYYKAFAEYTGDSRWNLVADEIYNIIDQLNAKTGAGVTGLLPDWTTASGDPVTGMGFDYTWDATRVPWRLAMDAAWYGDTRALNQLAKLNQFFSGVGAPNIRAGYTLDGQVINNYKHIAFTAPAASGAIVSNDSNYKTTIWNETVALRNQGYYGEHLRLLSLLFMSGNMQNPLN